MEIGDYMCNDGLMKLEITGTENRGGFSGKYTVYHIVGNDSLGTIDVMRRFSEFLIFHEKLQTRYPGLCIPAVPAKKS